MHSRPNYPVAPPPQSGAPSILNLSRLEANSEFYRHDFLKAQPFPHLVIDDFLLPEFALNAVQFFPTMAEMDTLQDFRQFKAQDPDLSKFHPIFQEIVFQHLHAPPFLELLSRITDMPHLRADPQLYAGGLAQGANGSFLNVHIDNSSHPVHPWYRRLNLLIYLNPNWTEEKGGHLELWNNDMSDKVAIQPRFNRMVIFATDRRSWHGYRQVCTPDGDTRKSINIYYFTSESPDSTDYYHITSFRARRNQLFQQCLYSADNGLRSLARRLRPQKDRHAVLFEGTLPAPASEP